MSPFTRPVSLPATTHSYLARAAEPLSDAVVPPDVPTPYASAHLASLRPAAALIGTTSRDDRAPIGGAPPVDPAFLGQS